MAEKEYIEREKFKNILESKAEMAFGTSKAFFYSVVKMLELIPAADVVEVKHGEWLPDFETFVDDSERESEPIQTGWVCSLCGRQEFKKEPYCHCGAKMDGKGD